MIFLNLLDFETDENFLLPQKYFTHTYVYNKKETDVVFDENPEYILRVIFSLTRNKKKISRVYIKIQEVAANTGGIIKVIFIILYFVNKIFAKVSFLKYMKQRILLKSKFFN